MTSKPKPTEQRWALMGDTHNGATTGLTLTPQNATQSALLDRYNDAIAWFGPPPDVVLLNGDGIDGADRKSGDTITSRMHEQARDCAKCLMKWNATREYIIVGGTGYHTEENGQELDRMIAGYLEELLREARDVNVKVTYHHKLNTTINQWFRLQSRHKIGRSAVPHGRATGPMRSKMWGVLNSALTSARNGKPAHWPHLLCFSHVHYWVEQKDDFGAVIVLPCWQAHGSKYGDKEMDGHVTLGCSRLTVGAKEDDGWSLDTRRYLPAVVSRVEHR